MNVTGVTHFLVSSGTPKNFIFVRVDTDEGISGWGEAYTQTDREPAIAAYVDRLGQYLVGRDPFNVKHFTHAMYHDVLVKRGSMESYCALSGIEIALWDIVGKKLGAPVYNLLGGACRDKIRVYANGWAGNPQDPDAVAARAVETVRMGFDALKWDPFPDPWRAYISKYEEDLTVEGVAAVRAAVGPDVDLLVEVHRRLAPMHAVRVARRIEQYNPFWYEEPVSARNLPGAGRQQSGTSTSPVVTGEELYRKAEFREVFESRAADIINPDICNTGGILELKEDRGDGGDLLRRGIASQLQQHHGRLGGDVTPLRDNPQLPHNRVLRQSRRHWRRACDQSNQGRQRLHPAAHRSRPRHRAR